MLIDKIIRLYCDEQYIISLEKITEDFSKRVSNKDTKQLLEEVQSIKSLLCQKK